MFSIISDSHIPRRADEIPEEFLERVSDSELTIHCGDLTTRNVLDELENLSDVKAVKGNCEKFDLPVSETFNRKDIDLGAYHGSGIHPRGDLDTLVSIAEKLGVKVLFHGHTHRQEAVEADGKILLNPGSCTGVGGGSSEKDSPRMMEVKVKDSEIKVNLIELVGSELKSSTRTFEV